MIEKKEKAKSEHQFLRIALFVFCTSFIFIFNLNFISALPNEQQNSIDFNYVSIINYSIINTNYSFDSDKLDGFHATQFVQDDETYDWTWIEQHVKTVDAEGIPLYYVDLYHGKIDFEAAKIYHNTSQGGLMIDRPSGTQGKKIIFGTTARNFDGQFYGNITINGGYFKGDGSELTNVNESAWEKNRTLLAYLAGNNVFTNNNTFNESVIIGNNYYLGTPVDFEKADDTYPACDQIGGYICLTRYDDGGTIFNYNITYDDAEQTMFGGTAPSNTSWNSEGLGNLSNYESRTYKTFANALDGAIGSWIKIRPLIMHDLVEDKYYIFKFTSWTQGGGGGGFAYTRWEILKAPENLTVHGDIHSLGLYTSNVRADSITSNYQFYAPRAKTDILQLKANSTDYGTLSHFIQDSAWAVFSFVPISARDPIFRMTGTNGYSFEFVSNDGANNNRLLLVGQAGGNATYALESNTNESINFRTMGSDWTIMPNTLTIKGDGSGIRASGYYSSDGTEGYTGSCASTTTLTVKDGLITGCS